MRVVGRAINVGAGFKPALPRKFPSWEGCRRRRRGGFPAPCADVTPSTVPAQCAGTGQGEALPVFASRAKQSKPSTLVQAPASAKRPPPSRAVRGGQGSALPVFAKHRYARDT
jgi:hypothetical protein